MSTAQTWRTVSNGLADTLQLGEAIGRNLRGSEVIELISDLGGGKTSFVKGLARGFGSVDEVRSPSFTLSNEYRAGDRTMYHLDFYRLHEPGIMRDEIAEILTDPQAVVVIEWAEIVGDMLPADHLTIHITALGELQREFKLAYAEKHAYILNGLL